MKLKPTIIAITALLLLVGCRPSPEELAAIKYTPLPGDDWKVSTPAEQGLEPQQVAELFYHAAELENIYGLLLIKNGHLIAEDYFNSGAVDKKTNLKSVTKSYTSALIGIAIEQGHLSSVDQKMMDFFPELTDQIEDARKNQIRIGQLLQMRAGYPWEESSDELFELLYYGFRPSTLVEVPLNQDPGTGFQYSNLSSHLLGIIVARAGKTDLKSYAQEHLFSPLDTEIGEWVQDWEGYYLGFADLHLRARDMAKFGQLYLDEGMYLGKQIVPADWIDESLQIYSQDAWKYRVGKNFQDIGYGYQWWSVTAGEHPYKLAWGHGGQQIALLEEHNMVIVLTADPLHAEHGNGPWKQEKSHLNLVADFIASLPKR